MGGRGAATAGSESAAEVFDGQRDFLVGVAYRVLGSVADAEDAVQDAWLRWAGCDLRTIADPRAFLVTVTTRLALDRLRRERTRRESYIGAWLPEPLPTGPDVAADVERAESVSLALLVVLETLSPLERAVFVLREAFGYSHAEVAAILGRNEAAVRQLARRAREHVEARRPRFAADEAARSRVTARFLAACQGGDLPALLDLLAPDVTLVADSGGRTLAPARPLRGAWRVSRFLESVATPERTARFLASAGIEPGAEPQVALIHLNGGPAIVASAAGRPFTVVLLDVADNTVRAVYLITNPQKLAALARNAPWAAPTADAAGEWPGGSANPAAEGAGR